MTIEERAKSHVECAEFEYEEPTFGDVEKAYMQGATDQEQIELQQRKEAVLIMFDGMIFDYKKQWVEKAKIAFCKSTCKGYQDIGRCLCDGHCDNFNQFLKLLNE